MARPFKARRVCSQPMVEVFGPLDQDAATRVELTLEEYGRLRLMQEVVADNTAGIVASVTEFNENAVIDRYTEQLIEEGLI